MAKVVAPRVAAVLTVAAVVYLAVCHQAQVEEPPVVAGAMTEAIDAMIGSVVAHLLAAVLVGPQAVVAVTAAVATMIPLEQDIRYDLRHVPTATATEIVTDGALEVIAHRVIIAPRLDLMPRHVGGERPQKRRSWETSELRNFQTILRALCVGERDSTTLS